MTMKSSGKPDKRKMKTDQPTVGSSDEIRIRGPATPLTIGHREKRRRKSTGIPPQFPRLLHSMLDRSEEDGYSDIVSWLPHGKSFVIRDREEFVRRVLPKYFKQTRFSSFQRQLNLYGFVRVERSGPDHKSYYHAKFLRDEPELVETMGRIKSEAVSFAHWSPKSDPDFSAAPSTGDLNIAPAYGDTDNYSAPAFELLPPSYDIGSSASAGEGSQALGSSETKKYLSSEPSTAPSVVEQYQKHQPLASPDESLDQKLPASALERDVFAAQESPNKDNSSMAEFLADVDLESP